MIYGGCELKQGEHVVSSICYRLFATENGNFMKTFFDYWSLFRAIYG